MKLPFTRKRSVILLIAGAAIFVSLFMWGCSGSGDSPLAPANDDNVLSLANPKIQAIIPVQERHTKDLMSNSDVLGTAVTIDENGAAAIMVLVNNAVSSKIALTELEGVPVQLVYTDKIVAMKGGGGHTAIQTPPIQLGTSGGWRYDLANGYCCGGTLGSLIRVGADSLRILSNYHVFEADIVNGGNGRTAQTGDPIIQPGLIDVGCNANSAQNVATLVKTSSLPGSNVDASSATVIAGQVDESGAILEVGTLSSSTVAAFVNQKVKKSGRTTGLSRATVSGLNATVSVAYDNECAGGAAFTKTYTGQILTTNKGSRFLAGGDSGSLMVEDVATNPRAVGLLYAGSSTLAVANPINEVLSFFGATMVGN